MAKLDDGGSAGVGGRRVREGGYANGASGAGNGDCDEHFIAYANGCFILNSVSAHAVTYAATARGLSGGYNCFAASFSNANSKKRLSGYFISNSCSHCNNQLVCDSNTDDNLSTRRRGVG